MSVKVDQSLTDIIRTYIIINNTPKEPDNDFKEILRNR